VSPARLRGAAFAALALFIALAPSWRQVFGGDDDELLRAWRMFAGPGRGLVDARFVLRGADGRERPVDRYAVLGFEVPRAAPPPVRRPRGPGEFYGLVRRLCERLGPGADLRAQVRVAVRSGWRPLDLGDRSLCAPPPDPRAPS
jgi:hypothetical protein